MSLLKEQRVERIVLSCRDNWSQRKVVDLYDKTRPNKTYITDGVVS